MVRSSTKGSKNTVHIPLSFHSDYRNTDRQSDFATSGIVRFPNKL
jgi:hypothetical protein